jgi:hypothetical protein
MARPTSVFTNYAILLSINRAVSGKPFFRPFFFIAGFKWFFATKKEGDVKIDGKMRGDKKA